MSDKPNFEADATLQCGVRLEIIQHEPGQIVAVTVTPKDGTTLNDSIIYTPEKMKLVLQPEVVLGINTLSDYMLGVTARYRKLARFNHYLGFFVGVLTGLLLVSGLSWILLHI